MHRKKHKYAGKKVKIKDHVKHPQIDNFGGQFFIVEDWWDRISGKSWYLNATTNSACIIYSVRKTVDIPIDDEVVYGKDINGLGHILHNSEIISLHDELQIEINNKIASYIELYLSILFFNIKGRRYKYIM